MANYQRELTQRAESLKIELQEMQKSFEMKREEFLKVQGALEMLKYWRRIKQKRMMIEL